MSLARVHNFSISLDGFGTGAGQSAEAHFGHAGDRLHQWMFATPNNTCPAPPAVHSPSQVDRHRHDGLRRTAGRDRPGLPRSPPISSN